MEVTMANGRNAGRKRDTGRDAGGFVALPWSVLDSAAYEALSHPARSLLMEVARQFVRDNNGRLLMSNAYLLGRGWRSSDVITRAKRELLAAGFVHETVKGHRPNKASWYAITWRELDRIPGFDVGARETFTRGAYHLKTPGTKKSLTPPHGVESAVIAPPHGVEEVPPTPSHGAISAVLPLPPTPSHGDHLENHLPDVGSPDPVDCEAAEPGKVPNPVQPAGLPAPEPDVMAPCPACPTAAPAPPPLPAPAPAPVPAVAAPVEPALPLQSLAQDTAHDPDDQRGTECHVRLDPEIHQVVVPTQRGTECHVRPDQHPDPGEFIRERDSDRHACQWSEELGEFVPAPQARPSNRQQTDLRVREQLDALRAPSMPQPFWVTARAAPF